MFQIKNVMMKQLFKNQLIRLKGNFSQNKFLIYNLILSILILLFPFVLIKKNRIDSGNLFSFYKVLRPEYFFIIIFIIILSILMFLILPETKLYKKVKIYTNALVFQTILIIFIVRLKLFSDNKFFNFRISFGVGFVIFIFLFFYNTLLLKSKINKKILFVFSIIIFNVILFIYFYYNNYFKNLGIYKEFITKQSRFFYEFNTHIYLSILSIINGTIIGYLLGFLAFKNKKLAGLILQATGFFQTIPSLALFGILIIPLSILSNKFVFLKNIGIKGIGKTPALIALIIYSLLPIVRNTYTSFLNLDKDVIESATGMGMNSIQLFFKIQFPLTLPIVMAGIKISSIQTIGNTTLAALIGAGGLGTFVFQGLGQGANDLILLGALPITFLAIITDLLFSLLIILIKKKY